MTIRGHEGYTNKDRIIIFTKYYQIKKDSFKNYSSLSIRPLKSEQEIWAYSFDTNPNHERVITASELYFLLLPIDQTVSSRRIRYISTHQFNPTLWDSYDSGTTSQHLIRSRGAAGKILTSIFTSLMLLTLGTLKYLFGWITLSKHWQLYNTWQHILSVYGKANCISGLHLDKEIHLVYILLNIDYEFILLYNLKGYGIYCKRTFSYFLLHCMSCIQILISVKASILTLITVPFNGLDALDRILNKEYLAYATKLKITNKSTRVKLNTDNSTMQISVLANRTQLLQIISRYHILWYGGVLLFYFMPFMAPGLCPFMSKCP